MITGVALIPMGPRYIPYGWVFVVVVMLLIALIFIRVYGRETSPGGGLHTGPGGGLHTVPVACQNEAGTTDIERHPDDDRTGRDQESSSWPWSEQSSSCLSPSGSYDSDRVFQPARKSACPEDLVHRPVSKPM